jgi:hypothetical protein
MTTVLEECNTEEQHSFVRFLWAKELNAKNIHKEIFPVYGGNCLSRKAVHNWVEKFPQGRTEVADVEMEVRNWLRQQSKHFHAAGFDALVKRWDKSINVGGGCVEKYIFFPGSNITCYTFLSISDLFTDSSSYK